MAGRQGLDWVILRVASSQTLNLAASLAEDGFNVWTPSEIVQKLRARRGQKREDIPAPIMPSFVFADAGQLLGLVALSRSPSLTYRIWDSDKRRMVSKGHPRFSVFRHDGRYTVLPDRALEPLRLAERRQKPKALAVRFNPGDQVRLSEGGFEGLTGTVEKAQGQRTWVVFPGAPWAVEFPTWVLVATLDESAAVNVKSPATEQALSAKAA